MTVYRSTFYCLLLATFLSGCGGGGSGSSESSNDSGVDDIPDETGIDADADILNVWIINDDFETSAHMDGGDTFVNVISVEADGDEVTVTSPGIPNADFSRQRDTLNLNGQWAKLTVD